MRRRRTREETREAVLEAALRVASERTADSGPTSLNPLAAVRITDALAELNRRLRGTDPNAVPVTTGAVYNIWPTQEAFQRELLDRVLAAASVPEIERVVEQLDRGIAAGLPWDELVARCFGLDFEISFMSPTMFTMIGVTALGPVEQLRHASVDPNRRYVEDMTAILRRILRHGGRRLRAGRSMHDLIWAIEAVEVGYLVRRRVEPAVTRRSAKSRTVVQAAIVAIVEAFTEPRT